MSFSSTRRTGVLQQVAVGCSMDPSMQSKQAKQRAMEQEKEKEYQAKE